MSAFRCTVHSKGIVRDKRCMRLIFGTSHVGATQLLMVGKNGIGTSVKILKCSSIVKTDVWFKVVLWRIM